MQWKVSGAALLLLVVLPACIRGTPRPVSLPREDRCSAHGFVRRPSGKCLCLPGYVGARCAARDEADVVAMKVLAGETGTIADVEEKDYALVVAAGSHKVQLAGELIDHGARLDVRSRQGWTATFAAALSGDTAMLSSFASRPGVLYDGPGGLTPLMVAVEVGHLPVVEILLSTESNPHRSPNYAVTPLVLAILARDDTALALLLTDLRKRPQWDAQAGWALVVAAGSDHSRAMADILRRDMAGGALEGYGAPALLLAAAKGHADAVARLLEAGVPIESELEGRTALSEAVGAGHTKAMVVLLARGARIDHATADGATPLVLACEGGHENAVRLIVGAGADVNQMDSAGRTPVEAAKSNRHDHVVAWLVAHGARLPLEEPQPPLVETR